MINSNTSWLRHFIIHLTLMNVRLLSLKKKFGSKVQQKKKGIFLLIEVEHIDCNLNLKAIHWETREMLH